MEIPGSISSVEVNHYMKQWAGLFGAINVLNDHDYPYEIAHKILENHNAEVPGGYWNYEEETGPLTINILLEEYNVIAISGWLKTNFSFISKIISIGEWAVVYNLGAQVAISIKGRLLIAAQAVDYHKNKKLYGNLLGKEHNCSIGAIALRMDKLPASSGFAENSCGYLPEDIHKPGNPFYRFTGIVMNHQIIKSNSIGIEGYVIEMRLVSLPENENYFVVNMFLNKENLFYEDFKNGGRVSGIAMFQVSLEID